MGQGDVEDYYVYLWLNGETTQLPDQPMPPGDQMQRCDTMNGNLVLVPRDVFNLLGDLSPEYTHAFGDVDYGMRARRSSVPIWVAPKHLGECAANRRVSPWTDPSVPLKERWRDMCGPRGLPPKQWYRYVKRHTGVAWPFYFVKPIVRVIFPRLWMASRIIRPHKILFVKKEAKSLCLKKH